MAGFDRNNLEVLVILTCFPARFSSCTLQVLGEA
jgi:hypothetical protein